MARTTPAERRSLPRTFRSQPPGLGAADPRASGDRRSDPNPAPSPGAGLTIRSVHPERSGTESPQGTNMVWPAATAGRACGRKYGQAARGVLRGLRLGVLRGPRRGVLRCPSNRLPRRRAAGPAWRGGGRGGAAGSRQAPRGGGGRGQAGGAGRND